MSKVVDLRLSMFKVNATPPLGYGVCGGLMSRATHVLAPNWVRGIVMHHGGTRHVLCAFDCTYLVGRSQTRFEDALAAGAAVPRSQCVVQSNHVHAAPMVNEENDAWLVARRPEFDFHDETWYADLLRRVEAAVRDASAEAGTPVSGVSHASHAVKEFASTRRVLDKEDKAHIRWSFCRDPWIKMQPEGKTDPLLDQILFYDSDHKPFVALNYYASHPQVGIIEGALHGDTIGVALDLFETACPGIFPIYFDGCGGDITAGKYTDALVQKNLHTFGVKLYDAMLEARLKSRFAPLETLGWLDTSFDCPLAPVQFSLAQIREGVDTSTDGSTAYLWAVKDERLASGRMTHPFRITRLQLNDIGALHLPAELVVEYQLFSKEQFKGKLCVAAYGDSYLNYVGTDEMFAQGGYEVEPIWTEVGPGIEDAIKSHILPVLDAPL